MSTESPADRLRYQYELLAWGNQAVARQTATIRASFDHAAVAIVTALLSPTTYQCTVDLTAEIITDSSQVVKLNKPITLHAGNMFQRMRHLVCHDELLKKLIALEASSDPVTAQIARLVNYTAAGSLLTRLPAASEIANMRAFDHKKQRLCSSDEEAESIIDQLLSYVGQLHLAEQLYAGWMASEVYTEKRSALLRQITEQGRSFAHMQTLRLIEELKQAWQRDTIGGGLTLFIPYIDERTYQMSKFPVEVMPNARIPFRPDFVVSACRLAEREVRQNAQYAQSTRWQLLAQLDLITQAFDANLNAGTLG